VSDQLSMDRIAELRGAPVYDRDAEKIGKVDEIFYDNDTNQPEWIGIGSGFFSSKRVLVPVQGATVQGDGITVPYAKDLVKDSPDISGDEIDEHTESDLYAYYSLQSSRSAVAPTTDGADFAGSDRTVADTGDYAAGDRVAGDRDLDRQTGLPNVGEESLTRSEEELRVGKREVESGRVRLRKWVETEPVEANVELRRETVHVHREPVDGVVEGGQIGEQEIETTLRSEEAVVDKQTVARERVSLDKDVEVEQQTVSDEVRKERVEVEGADTDDDVLRRDR
jgi:uncharacterized protein (TIGR02271 family)